MATGASSQQERYEAFLRIKRANPKRKRLEFLPRYELDERARDFDEHARLAEIDPETERQIRKDVEWLERWSPAIGRFAIAYSFVAEFGVQLTGTILLALILVGVFGLTFTILFIVAYALLLSVAFFRFRIVITAIEKVYFYAHVAHKALQEEAKKAGHDPEILGPAPPPVPEAELVRDVRKSFRRGVYLQSASLLLVLFFAMRIIGAPSSIFGFDTFDLFLGLVTRTLGSALANVILTFLALWLGVGGARLQQKYQS